MSTVLITGGAKRIGAEISQFFASKGFDIALHCNKSRDIAEKHADFLRAKYQIMCKVYQFDLENITEVPNFFSQIVCDFKQISVLINNASFFEKSTIKTATPDTLLQNFAVHFFSPIILAQSFAKQDGLEDGLIINFLDKNTNRTKTQYFEYIQSKKSLWELTKYLAVELAPKIRTNAISPGFIIEEEGSSVDVEYLKAKFTSIPLQRKGSINDIILAVEYLLNAKYVNGQNLFVDGGASLLND